MMSFMLVLMNFLIVKGGDITYARNVHFLENNFWSANKEIESKEGHLFRVAISIEGEMGKYVGVYHDSTTCFVFKHKNIGYIVLDESLMEEINSIKKTSRDDKLILKFQFLFTDEPIKDDSHLKTYKGERRNFITYKLLEKTSDNNFNLIGDGIEIRKHHIKERLKGFVYIKNLLKLEQCILDVNKKATGRNLEDLEEVSEFKLYYFKNYSECLKNLVEFANNLKHFSLIDDNYILLNNQDNTKFTDSKTTLKVSQFKKRLIKMFIEKQTELQFNYSESIEKSKVLKILFINCCEHLKDEIIAKNILFPIGDKYNIEFYLNKMFYHIVDSLKEILPNINSIENFSLIFDDVVGSLDIFIEELQITAVKDLCDSKYMLKHFSTLLKREFETLEDFIILEKMVIDYYNTFAYIVNCDLKIEDSLCNTFSYFSPIYIDDFKYKVVEGYEVTFKSSDNFERIKAFDFKGKEFILEKDIDFFIDKFNTLYCTVDVLKTKNVHEIKIISLDNVL